MIINDPWLIGTVTAWPRQSPLPDGWMLADGRKIYKRDNPDLYQRLTERGVWPKGIGLRGRWVRIPDLRRDGGDLSQYVMIIKAVNRDD